MIGMPSEPKATGAVLPISASVAACKRAEAEADEHRSRNRHGAPKPAAPSMNAPKLKAISSDLDPAVSRETGDRILLHDFEMPGVDVIVVDETSTFRTIQPMGNRP